MSDAKNHLSIVTGGPCSYGGRFMKLKNNHGANRIHARLRISAPGMVTDTKSVHVYPSETADLGCSRASPSQRKKFEITFAEFS